MPFNIHGGTAIVLLRDAIDGLSVSINFYIIKLYEQPETAAQIYEKILPSMDHVKYQFDNIQDWVPNLAHWIPNWTTLDKEFRDIYRSFQNANWIGVYRMDKPVDAKGSSKPINWHVASTVVPVIIGTCFST
jgi:hypothetical protein